MHKLIALIILILSACVLLSAQSSSTSLCPVVSVDGPAGIVAPGNTGTYSARITNTNEMATLQYRWSISAGEIVSGQGTRAISVKQPGFETVTVTLEVKGLPNGCPNVTSETQIIDPGPQAIRLGQVADLTSPSTSDLLEHVVRVIKDNPNAQLYILSGRIGGKASIAGSTKERELLRDLSEKGIDQDQISVTGVFAEVELFQLWLVPAGANSPRCKECEELEKAAKAPHCPTISLDGPAGGPGSDGLMMFTGKINGPVPKNATYMWTVKGGEIVNGQGTKSIKVHQTSEESGDLVATLLYRFWKSLRNTQLSK